MYCSKCGTGNAADASFCSTCGTALAGGTVAEGAFDEEAWRAALGPKNTDYYLERFARQHADGTVARWHWPAFFVTFYWLLYRKLWGSALLYFVIPYIVGLVLGVVGGVAGRDGGPVVGVLWLVFLVAYFIVPPMFANPLLYTRCERLIERQKAANGSRLKYLAQIDARGGTSLVGAIILGVFVVIAIIGMLAAIALPAYNDYTKRAKVAEALVTGRAAATQVGDYLERNGALPASMEAVQVAPSRFVQSMQLDPGSGVIEIVVGFGGAARGGSVYLVPSRADGGHVTWRCKAAPEMQRVVPASCRGD